MFSVSPTTHQDQEKHRRKKVVPQKDDLIKLLELAEIAYDEYLD